MPILADARKIEGTTGRGVYVYLCVWCARVCGVRVWCACVWCARACGAHVRVVRACVLCVRVVCARVVCARVVCMCVWCVWCACVVCVCVWCGSRYRKGDCARSVLTQAVST